MERKGRILVFLLKNSIMKNTSPVILIWASHVLLAQTNSANWLQKAIKAYEKAQYIKAGYAVFIVAVYCVIWEKVIFYF